MWSARIDRGDGEVGPHIRDTSLLGGHVCFCVLATEFDRNAGRARADIENWSATVPHFAINSVGERAVDFGEVHRVVIARLSLGVHHLGFESARQHRVKWARERDD